MTLPRLFVNPPTPSWTPTPSPPGTAHMIKESDYCCDYSPTTNLQHQPALETVICADSSCSYIRLSLLQASVCVRHHAQVIQEHPDRKQLCCLEKQHQACGTCCSSCISCDVVLCGMAGMAETRGLG